MSCDECGSSSFGQNLDGTQYCNDCGALVTSSALVSNISFGETSSGAKSVMGRYINTESGRFRGDPSAATIERVTQRMHQIGEEVKLRGTHIDQGLRLYKLALNMRFTCGRRRDYVIAACLYVVCRRNSTPHLLIDLSDTVEISVYKLGQVFVQLCLRLKLQLPLIDPSLYIERFASQLEFADRERLVVDTAIRIIQRMNRDWIQTGRRPHGLCGAALMIAGRMHGFDRTTADVVDIVRIGDGTLRKRISEFLNTPSVDLTPAQFHSMDLKSDAVLPPCMITNQKRSENAEKKRKRKRKSKSKSKSNKSSTKKKEKEKKKQENRYH